MTTDRDDITDPALARLLREAADESPPAHVDATILAAALRAVEPPRRVRSGPAPPWRWLLPLGAAATIAAVVFSLQPLAPTPVEPVPSAEDAPAREVDRSVSVNPTPPPSANAFATAPAKEQSRALADARSFASAVEAERKPPAQRQKTRKAAAETPAAPPAAALAGAPAATLAEAPAKGRAEVPAAVASSREAAAPRADAGRDVAAWIERIRELVRESRRDEAARELDKFRAAFADADARLPDDLRAFDAQARAKRVRPQ